MLNKCHDAPFWGQNIGVDNYPKAVIITDGLCGANKVYCGKTGNYHNHASEFVECNECGTIAAQKITPNSEEIYEITNKNEPYWFSLFVNSGIGVSANDFLKNDIKLNDNVLKSDRTLNSGTFYEWTPIGSDERRFIGDFKSDGRTISGLYINRPNEDYVGLFRSTTSASHFKAIGVIDSYICGHEYVGSIAGYGRGSAEYRYTVATLIGDKLSYIGGTDGSYNCYLSDSNGNDARATQQFENGEAAYYLSNSGESYWGQLLGTENPDPLPVHLTEANRVYFANDTYHNHDVDSDYCPYCKTILAVKPRQNANNEYEISNKGELLWFAEYVNAGNLTANAVLTADIVVNDKVFDDDGNPLPDLLTIPVMGSYIVTSSGTTDKPFNGSFRGNGHTISGLYYNEASTKRIGLIGYAGSSAEISGVRITNSYINGGEFVGGVCGYSFGSISGCNSDGCVITGKNVGGICGWNEGTITYCFNASNVIGENAGGICGTNNTAVRESVSYCISLGKLSGDVGRICGETGGTCANCLYLADNPLEDKLNEATPLSLIGISNDNVLNTYGFGSEWAKTANDTANKKLYFPRLAAFSGNDISVGYTPKLVIENTNTTPMDASAILKRIVGLA